MSKLIRISDNSYSKLEKIAHYIGQSQQEILEQAIKNLEKEIILKKANNSYATTRKNSQLWQKEQEELTLWETTLRDGLKDE